MPPVAALRALGRGMLLAALYGAGTLAQTPGDDLPRLTGTVISRDHRAAIFESVPGLPVSVLEGETISAYTVRSIGPDGVQVERDGRRVALLPARSVAGAGVADTGGVTFGRVVNPQRPPDD